MNAAQTAITAAYLFFLFVAGAAGLYRDLPRQPAEVGAPLWNAEHGNPLDTMGAAAGLEPVTGDFDPGFVSACDSTDPAWWAGTIPSSPLPGLGGGR